MRHLLAVLACYLALVAGPARADGSKFPQRYVESNVIAIFFHEIGHALIDVLDLPIYGQEEDAADVLSAFLIDAMFSEKRTLEIAYDVAHGFWDEHELEDRPIFFGVHGPYQQRYFTFVCLIFGANPEARQDYADEMNLPYERQQTCPDEFRKAEESWGSVLSGLEAAGPGRTFPVRFAGRADRYAVEVQSILRPVIKELDKRGSLRLPVRVRIEPCGEPNAFYDDETREIIMCTEYVSFLYDQLD